MEMFKMIGENPLGSAVIIFLILTLAALIVSILLWKALPESNQARYEGKQWKLGGAFAAFVIVWFGGWYMLEEINEVLIGNQAESAKLKEKELAAAEININEKIKDFELDIEKGVKIEIIEPPIETEDYAKLFSNLDKNSELFAYNAPFRLEHTGAGSYREKSVKTHVKRYKEDAVKSQYVFFYEGSYRRAEGFFAEVKKKLDPKLHSNIESVTRFDIDANKKPCHTFFLAKKNNKKVIIYYPDPYRGGGKEEGMPKVVIVVTNADNLYKKFAQKFRLAFDEGNLGDD